MVQVIVQVSDVHIGGPAAGSGERFSQAVDAINAMTRQPDLVLVTGDITQSGTTAQWDEFLARIEPLRARWDAIRGNHDARVDAYQGHRTIEVGPWAVVLLDTSSEVFSERDAEWLDRELTSLAGRPTAIALHHPPFETGIWWMDCVELQGIPLVEGVVRRHPHTRHVMAGHVHRPITTTWGGCLVTTCPSTAVAIAADLDPHHDPAETAEPPMVAMHAYLADSVVSHTFAVGPPGDRWSIAANAPDFVRDVRAERARRTSEFDR